MERFVISVGLLCIASLLMIEACRAGGETSYKRIQDVVYGRKDGTALTMDVFTPKKDANGAAVIWVVSGGWFSSHAAINPQVMDRSPSAAIPSSPSFTAASRATRSRRFSRTCTAPSATSATTPRNTSSIRNASASPAVRRGAIFR